MKKILMPIVLSSLLTACGGGGGGTGGNNSAAAVASDTQAQNATPSVPCPVVNATFERVRRDGETKLIYLSTAMQGSLYSYSYDNPELSLSNFLVADATWHPYPNDDRPGDQYQLSCDAHSITWISQRGGHEQITIHYILESEDRLRIETKGPARFQEGHYRKER